MAQKKILFYTNFIREKKKVPKKLFVFTVDQWKGGSRSQMYLCKKRRGLMSQIPPEKRLVFGQVIIYAGAVLAFLIGAAFATGQEVLMYYVAWGKEMFAVIAVVLLILIWSTFSFALVGERQLFQSSEDIFTFFCGKYVGKFYDYFSTFFCYACYLFMIAGVGSTLQQQFKIPSIVGVVGLSVVTVLTVFLGLQKITDILGRIGTGILTIILLVSMWTLLKHWNMVGPNLEAIETLGPEHFGIEKSIAPNALFNGLNYMGTVILWFITFVTMMASQARGRPEVKVGAALGSATFMVSMLIVALAMISVIGLVGASDVPSIMMAENIWPPLASVFSVIVVAGSYTTAVPLLWMPVSRFAEDGSKKAKILSCVLGLIGVGIALLVPYRTLMNYIMNIGGMLTYILYVFIMWTDFKLLYRHFTKKRSYTCKNA